MAADNWTLEPRRWNGARVLRNGVPVGHLSAFAGQVYVNGGFTFGFAHVAHVATLDKALLEFIANVERIESA